METKMNGTLHQTELALISDLLVQASGIFSMAAKPELAERAMAYRSFAAVDDQPARYPTIDSFDAANDAYHLLMTAADEVGYFLSATDRPIDGPEMKLLRFSGAAPVAALMLRRVCGGL